MDKKIYFYQLAPVANCDFVLAKPTMHQKQVQYTVII